MTKTPTITKSANIVGFNFASVAAADRDALREHSKQIRILARKSCEAVIEIGRRLIAVQKILREKRQFIAFLKGELKLGSEQTAYNWINAAKHFSDVKSLDCFTPTALFLLSQKNVSDAVRSDAKDLAAAGEHVNLPVAKALVEERAPAGELVAEPECESHTPPPAANAEASAGAVRPSDVVTLASTLQKIRKYCPAEDRATVLRDLLTRIARYFPELPSVVSDWVSDQVAEELGVMTD